MSHPFRSTVPAPRVAGVPRRGLAKTVLSKTFLAGGLAAGALALAGCSGTAILPAPDLPTTPVILDETAAAAAISRYRASHGLGPVVIDASLVSAASYQAGANARAGQLLQAAIIGSPPLAAPAGLNIGPA